MSIQFLNPDGIAPPTGYTHVVMATGGKMIFISGQIGVDPQGNIAEGLEAQTTQVFENLKTALAAVGATFDDLLKVTTYIVNYKPEDRATVREIRSRYFNREQPPASTLVGVQALAIPGLLIEIEAIARVER
ncbi:MAG TPA: RidA family protein [Anaerolineae bacterium]|nr:RidA family protein [Anaerolineae bacterium]